MSIPGTVDQTVTLAMILDRGWTGLYPQAEVYDGASLEDTIDLADMGQGRYEGEWTPTVVGTYSVVYNVYQDAGHTIQLTPIMISREIEQVFISQSTNDDLAAMIVRLLGLNLENGFIDRCVYDENLMLLSARIRIFDSKTNLDAASENGDGETGTIAEYVVGAEHYGPNRLRWHKMGKV